MYLLVIQGIVVIVLPAHSSIAKRRAARYVQPPTCLQHDTEKHNQAEAQQIVANSVSSTSPITANRYRRAPGPREKGNIYRYL